MQMLWCWRCQTEVPMLDEEEFALLQAKMCRFSRANLQAALAEYQRLTGVSESNVNVIWHHRIAQYGPPCPGCGKVLRTPVAYKCFECGRQIHEPNWSLLFSVDDKFQIPDRGIVLVAPRDVVAERLSIGEHIEIRAGTRPVARCTVEGIEMFMDARARDIGLLLSTDASFELIERGQDVWHATKAAT